jgi:hypothetical protein
MNDTVEDVDEDPEDLDGEELDEEDLDEELDEDLLEGDALAGEDDGDETAEDEEDDEDADDVPAARKRPGTSEEDDDEADPDDVEADLDSILKDKMASSEDDEDEEEETPETPAEAGERVAAKGADEFTCNTCFLIVHPRQFGRAGNLHCPEGYDPCPSIKKVEAMLKKAKKG